MDDSYRTIARESVIEIKIKGSRFIGDTRLVDGIEEATNRLAEIRKREYGATHHCWAYRVGTQHTPAFKYSDDGEPGGTAGKPILDVLVGDNITNCLLVVTRYFGGTKLGAGGLVHAYSDAARRALDASGVQTRYLTVDYLLEMDFTCFSSIQHMLARLHAEIRDSNFTDRVTLRVAVRRSLTHTLEHEYVEATKGKAVITRLTAPGKN